MRNRSGMHNTMLACCLVLAMLPQLAQACGGETGKRSPQAHGDFESADAVVVGRVKDIEQAPMIKDATKGDRSVYRIGFRVENWEKGSTPRITDVLENTRTNCSTPPDHIHVAKQSNPSLYRWRLYLKKARQVMWVQAAERID